MDPELIFSLSLFWEKNGYGCYGIVNDARVLDTGVCKRLYLRYRDYLFLLLLRSSETSVFHLIK